MVIFFRCDAATFMGIGHVMRCSVLAFAFKQQGYRVVFLCTELEGDRADWLAQSGYEVVLIPMNKEIVLNQNVHSEWLANTVEDDVKYCLEAISNHDAIMVVDHYSINAQWHDLIKPQVKRLVVIDDLADRDYHCDVLIDPTLTRKLSDYKTKQKNPYCEYFIANQGILLRPEFSQSAHQPQKIITGHHVLISMGGCDSQNSLITVCQWIRSLSMADRITIMVSSQCSHIEEIKQYCLYNAVQLQIDCQNIAALMCQHNWFVGAFGSTTWERMALGLAGVGIEIADNQKPLATSVEQAGCRSLGHYKDLTPDMFAQLYRNAWQEYQVDQLAIHARLKQQIPLNQSNIIVNSILNVKDQ